MEIILPGTYRACVSHIRWHPRSLRLVLRKVANWLPRPGKARVTYAEGSSFEGVFNGERIKEGPGKYTWMKPAEEDGEDPQVCAFAHAYGYDSFAFAVR